MGRSERPLDPGDGPIARFAGDLRKLRQEAGGLTYRAMARRAHYSPATLAQAAAGDRLPSLPVALAYAQACGGQAEEWRLRWQEASREALERAAEEDDGAAPYLGLAGFEDGDRDRFFGRAALVGRLAELVGAHRLVLLVGPSGSGKSSVLRAGLVPYLRQADRARSVRVVTPGAQPWRTHAGLSGDLIVVDQFEEVFALCGDPARRGEFIGGLLALASDGGGSRVVLAVRADFFGHCAGHRELAEAVRDATVLMSPMNAAELREAIIKPAAGAGLVVERELTARIVAEVEGEPGGLPLMSHALLQTWRRRRSRTLTLAAYEAAGGIRSSIARTSEDLYAGLTPRRRERLRHLLLRLVTPGEDAQDTRRPVERAELATEDAGPLLERLAEARLVTLDESRVDLAHEALLTAWPRLRGWIEEDRERMRLQRRLTEAATAWRDHDRDPGGLYRGVRLSIAWERFAESDELTPLEREFLTAAVAARDGERRSRRRRTTAISVLLTLTLVAGLLAWQENQNGRDRQREAEARRVVGVAEGLRDTDPVTAMRLSLAAWRLADLPETRSALLAASAQRQQDVFIDPDGAADTMRHLSMDGRTLLSVGAAQVTAWDLDTHRKTASLPGLGAQLEKAGARSGDAWKLPLRSDGLTVTLWDLTSGTRDARPLGPAKHGYETGTSGRSVIGYDGDGSRYRIRVWDTDRRRELLTVSAPHPILPGRGHVAWESGPTYVRAEADRRDFDDPAFPDVTLSPDDRLLALCVPGERLQLWDVAGKRRLATPWAPRLDRRQCQYEQVRFTPDGRRLAVITREKVRLWDLASGKEVASIVHRNVKDIGFSADGAFLVASDGVDLLLWRISAPGFPVFRHALLGEQVGDLRIDLEANRVRFLAGPPWAWPATVRTLDLGRALTSGWREEAADSAVFGPGGSAMASAYVRDRSHVQVRLHRTEPGKAAADLPPIPCPEPPDMPSCAPLLAFSSDGRTLAFGGSAQEQADEPTHVSLWDVARGHTTGTLTLEELRRVGAIAFGPGDMSLLIAKGPQVGSTVVWDLRRGAVTETLDGVTANEVRLHPDQRLMVTSSGDVVDLPSGATAPGGPGPLSALAFAFGGGYLAAGDDTGRTALWDGRVRRRLGVLGAAGSDSRTAVMALAFSPDDDVLAVGSADGTLQLWDVASRRPIGSPLPTPGDAVLALAFSPDGRTLYAAGQHVPLQRYDLTPATTAAALCRRAGGGLSPEEWRTALPHDPFRPTC
ncbi:helix-turn-helix domain-containing protein [Nonomuraea sp. NPDC050643]|uniref:nSTAND1 domain-containing NTPase n=1 Tax=Nonomuraea sp. NPDC050643 TaxID=3155660 RepID=UPI00340E91F7